MPIHHTSLSTKGVATCRRELPEPPDPEMEVPGRDLAVLTPGGV